MKPELIERAQRFSDGLGKLVEEHGPPHLTSAEKEELKSQLVQVAAIFAIRTGMRMMQESQEDQTKKTTH